MGAGAGGVLVVVDVQRGFLNPYTAHIPERIARLVDARHYDPVLFTRFVNVAGSPYHRLLDWHDCAEPPETDIAPELERFAVPDRTFTKPGFTGLPDELTALLRQIDPERATIVGIDTDMCVLKVAMDVFDLGIAPVVLIDCCASTAGLQAHLAGLAVLSRNIGALQLHDAGLNNGTLAAPTR
ncbi:MAG TPA: isochorismatase family cysteine hydrolase [Thermomicrobiales bacterium]|nr:isochorismatase family cysteine hydrolase [Thermomicrobiales bacterium]